MVVVPLIGGLGNQMFQYAFGLRVATERRSPLIANSFLLNNRLLARFRNYTYRHFELSAFGVDTPVSSPLDLIRAMLPIPSNTVLLREPAGGVKALLLPPSTVNRVVCVGYWQSEEYFKPAEAAIRQQFVFRQPGSQFTQRLTERVLATRNSVFVHVRRGDYISNAKASQHHGVCGIDYYKQAIAYVRERIDRPQFYVFSDDLAWVSQELGPLLSLATYVAGNGGHDSWQDMLLMSHCRHGILANSSFSWWGAWLNPEPDRIVVAPRRWFADQPINDLLPGRWISL